MKQNDEWTPEPDTLESFAEEFADGIAHLPQHERVQAVRDFLTILEVVNPSDTPLLRPKK